MSILVYLFFSGNNRNKNKINGEYTIFVNILNNQYNECCKLIEQNSLASKVIRAETLDQRTSVYFNVSIHPNFDLQNLIGKLKVIDENSKIDFVESGVNW